MIVHTLCSDESEETTVGELELKVLVSRILCVGTSVTIVAGRGALEEAEEGGELEEISWCVLTEMDEVEGAAEPGPPDVPRTVPNAIWK
jgi:hypothetical protein